MVIPLGSLWLEADESTSDIKIFETRDICTGEHQISQGFNLSLTIDHSVPSDDQMFETYEAG